ncbi:MAG: transposase, partial [Lentisphaerota bacterium]
VRHLSERIAYDHWHRLLFARFLAENDLLISPDHGVGVSMSDCDDLAPELGMRDGWEVAARFAARMLPQIFRVDDPSGAVLFAPEDRAALRKLVIELPREIFLADDALGWVYQFWQAQRKEEVNNSGSKIGADEISPVTQLFTEDYMVLFLLHNTLGAWWAGKNTDKLAGCKSEEECRQAVALPGLDWTYLRFIKVARPFRSGDDQEVARPSRSGQSKPERDALATTTGEPERDALATTTEATIGLDSYSLNITEGENLPHWTCDKAIYHVCFRLADSVPQSVCDQWRREREAIVENARQMNRPLSEDEEDRIRYLHSERIEKFLDTGHGSCFMARPEIAELVADALRHFDGERYRLHAWCIMPNHVHVIVEPVTGHELSAIIHSWKSFTAHAANKALGRSGDYWQSDAYNHIIRSMKEYAFQISYAWENPEKAGLKNWKWRWKISRPSQEVARASRSGLAQEVARASRSGLALEVTGASRSGLAQEVTGASRSGLALEVARASRSGLAQEVARASRSGLAQEVARAS